MKIFKMKNKKNNILIFYADDFFSRLRGLIGKKLNGNNGLLLMPCNQVHTCFMKYPIDVIFVSDKNRVLHIEEDMKPFKIGKRIKNAKKILELQGGHSKELNIKVGDILVMEKTEYTA